MDTAIQPRFRCPASPENGTGVEVYVQLGFILDVLLVVALAEVTFLHTTLVNVAPAVVIVAVLGSPQSVPLAITMPASQRLAGSSISGSEVEVADGVMDCFTVAVGSSSSSPLLLGLSLLVLG